MKKFLILLAIPLLVFAGMNFMPANKLRIATSANTAFAMQEIASAFESETGIQTEIIIGSSGKLSTQIMQSAPFDIFVSADMDYPQKLYQKGFAIHPPKTYAHGKLVLWTINPDIHPSKKLNELLSPSVKKIAIANPKTAPYGLAAIQAMKNSGIYEQVKDKLVYGESIAQTNQFIVSGAADAGFTAKSVVLSDAMKDKGKWMEIDASAYDPIEQGAVILKFGQDEHPVEAKAFYQFLYSDAAREIFKNFGYD